LSAGRSRPCPICPDAGTSRSIGALRPTIGATLSRDCFDLVYCPCGDLVYLDPPPSADDLRIMYQESKQFTDALYTEGERVSAVLTYMRSCFDRIREKQDASRPANVLEVGAGYAWMCRAAKAAGAASRTTAQDVSAEVATSCTWVDRYVVGEITDPEVGSRGPYDVISLTHVIEHLVDPVAVIATCAKLLTPQGVLFVTAPHRPIGWQSGSLDLTPWSSYSYAHVPAHVQYFSRGSMERLARRTGLALRHWNQDHEEGQAFEAWLTPPHPVTREPLSTRLTRWLRGGQGALLRPK